MQKLSQQMEISPRKYSRCTSTAREYCPATFIPYMDRKATPAQCSVPARAQPCRRVGGFRRDRAADVGVSGSTRILSHDIHTIHGQTCKPPPCSVSTRVQPCRREAGFRRDRASDVRVSGSLSAGLHLAMPATQNL